jgi:hypothetical protein
MLTLMSDFCTSSIQLLKAFLCSTDTFNIRKLKRLVEYIQYQNHSHIEIDVTLRLTASQSVLVSCPLWDMWPDITSCQKDAVWKLRYYFCGDLCDERIGLQFAVQSLNGPSCAEPITILHCFIWDSPNLEGQVPVFIFPRNRVAQLYPQALGFIVIVIYYYHEMEKKQILFQIKLIIYSSET